ncbi:hypothetical protein HYU11_02625 [Candidatus Woesearchaeota archaeon]|nr:hypothetical protein [Candidatus Woesearchaeota archaeon]
MERVFFLDIDHTLSNFDSRAGDDAVRAELLRLFPEKEEAAVLFGEIFESVYSYHCSRSMDSFFADKINSFRVSIPENIPKPDLKFSREIYLKFISDKFGLGISGKEIMRIVDLYNDAIVRSTFIYPDSVRFMSRFKKKFIIAGSDNRLRFEGDRMVYDPEYSWKKRFERTMAVFSRFFNKDQVIIGDPFGKPSVQFWEKCVDVSGCSPEHSFVVDDSMNVVKSAMDFGFKGVLFDRYNAYDRNSVKALYACSFDDGIFDK